MRKLFVAAALLPLAGIASAVVYPTGAHAAMNFIPFGSGQTITMDQVFASSLFSSVTGGLPARITSIGFATGVTGTYNSDITIRMGYTNAIPGVAGASGGLVIPNAGGGGNNVGTMSTFYQNAAYTLTATSTSSSDFTVMRFNGSFDYDPTQGNLLLEIVNVAGTGTIDLSVSRTAGSAESSRAYNSTRFTSAESFTTASRVDFTYAPVPEPASMTILGLGAVALLRRRRR